MALRIALLVIFLGLVAATSASAGSIDPRLQAAMEGRDGLFPVLFVMASQFDLGQLDLEGLSRGERRRRIIEALQDHARRTQADILAYMRAPQPGETILAVGSLWLVNAVYALVDEPAIITLAAREDVGVAYLDEAPPSPVGAATWGQIKAQFSVRP